MPPAAISELSLDQLVLCAKTCPELRVPASNGSGVLVRAKKCCFCHQVKRMGAGKTDHALIEHMRSKLCRKAQRASAAPVPKLEPPVPKLQPKRSPSRSSSPLHWQPPAPPLTQELGHSSPYHNDLDSSPHCDDFDYPLAYPPIEQSDVLPGSQSTKASGLHSDMDPHSPSRFS